MGQGQAARHCLQVAPCQSLRHVQDPSTQENCWQKEGKEGQAITWASGCNDFMANIVEGGFVQNATQSEMVAAYVGASLANTWFAIPNGRGVCAPQTGSRPGDPCANVLFGYVMAHMLAQIQERAAEVQIPLTVSGSNGKMSNCVTWVGDIALAIMAEADQVVQHTQTLLSIIMDVTIEHGMRMSYGQGKTAVIPEFRGQNAITARKACEAQYPDGLTVLSEHDKPVTVPMVSHYKHLGVHVVRGGAKIPEIQIRAAAARQNVSPLKRFLSNEGVSDEHKRILVKSLGLSVLRLHASTWFALNRGEIDAWAAALFRTYQMLEGRKEGGAVQHRNLYQLASRMRAPMPVEFLHLERLRLFVHMLHVFDTMAIAAVLQNFRIAGANSWLHGVMASMRWAQSQVGTFALPDEVFGIVGWQGWNDLRDAVPHLRKVIKQVEAAHVYRVRTCNDLKQHADFQATLCREMGWTFHKEEAGSSSTMSVVTV